MVACGDVELPRLKADLSDQSSILVVKTASEEGFRAFVQAIAEECSSPPGVSEHEEWRALGRAVQGLFRRHTGTPIFPSSTFVLSEQAALVLDAACSRDVNLIGLLREPTEAGSRSILVLGEGGPRGYSTQEERARLPVLGSREGLALPDPAIWSTGVTDGGGAGIA